MSVVEEFLKFKEMWRNLFKVEHSLQCSAGETNFHKMNENARDFLLQRQKCQNGLLDISFFFFFFYRILQIRNSVRLKFKIIKRCIPIHVHTAIIPFFSFFFFFLLLLLLTMQKRSKWIFTIGFSPRNYTRVMRAG